MDLDGLALDGLAREQELHHVQVPVLRRRVQRRGPARRGLVKLDVVTREQEPHHLDVAVLRRHEQRCGPVLRGQVDLDALARKQKPHHVGPPGRSLEASAVCGHVAGEQCDQDYHEHELQQRDALRSLPAGASTSLKL